MIARQEQEQDLAQPRPLLAAAEAAVAAGADLADVERITCWIAGLPDLLLADIRSRWIHDIDHDPTAAVAHWSERIDLVDQISQDRDQDLVGRAGQSEEDIVELAETLARLDWQRELGRWIDTGAAAGPKDEAEELDRDGGDTRDGDDADPPDLRLLVRRWRRRLRRETRQAREHLALLFGLVGSGPGQRRYCSNQTLADRRTQLHLQDQWAGCTTARRGGEAIPMAGIAGVEAGRVRRRAELAALSKGISDLCERRGYTWAFFTFTLPPRFHPSPTCGENTWDPHLTPRDAQDALMATWALFRARLAAAGYRAGQDYIGFRIVEPHRDSCPHLHAMLWFPTKAHALEAERIAEDLTGGGPAVDVTHHDPNHPKAAAASSYAFKYLLKTLRGGRHGSDPVDAWASAWAIRRIAWIGVSAVSAWRACRRALAAVGDALDSPLTAAETLLWALLGPAGRGEGAEWFRALERFEEAESVDLTWIRSKESRAITGVMICAGGEGWEEFISISFGGWELVTVPPRLQLNKIIQERGSDEPPHPPPDPGPAPPTTEAA